MENYITVDAMDHGDDNFKGREKTCSEVIDMITQRFESKQVGSPEYFNSDLPLQL